ncbi:hypothetical protein Pfo_019223 [Paulownia fortunei]|nr:hypothetical protein Pfo_019223 [Paulownia fortunei]
MDGGKLQDRKLGSVKATIISSYGQQIVEANPAKKKFQKKYSEKPYTKTRELHQAKREPSQFDDSRKPAESVTAEAEAESKLSAAKKTVKDLTLRIEESNSRARAQMEDLEKLKMAKRREEECNSGNSQCEKVMRELESLKRELSKLKLDMASILEEKRRAEKETDSSMSKALSYSGSVEALTKEIEEINEEHVLVELARIEAIKEYREIEAQRREEAEKYLTAMEETRKKNPSIIQEIEDAKELETKLAITISDINMLESKLKQVEEMKKGLERNESLRYQIESNFQEEDESGSISLLELVTRELEATQKELTSVKIESIEFMASMDIVRNELRHVMEETASFKKKEEKAGMTIQNLNSKLLIAKANLEATSAAADKAESNISNLSLTLEQMKLEAKTTEKERSLISEETAVTKAEVQKTEAEIDLAEERLQAALQDLNAVKSSEAIALENLKAVIQNTMRNRASTSQRSSTITISRFEYEYLKGHAAGAIEIADKKVSAAEAWIEALKASEKEVLIKTDLSRRETRELRGEKERKVTKTEGSMTARKLVEDDFENSRQKMKPENLQPENAFPSKAMNRSTKWPPPRRAKVRRSASPAVHGTPRSSSFTLRRRKKEMPNLAKF